MRFFDGDFRILDSGYHDGINYKMKGTFVDETQVFFPGMVQVGDIIYADGSYLSKPLLRYKIVSIIQEETLGQTLSVIVKWDLEGVEATEPFGEMDAIIGALHPNNLTANLPPQSSLNKVVLARANSYQTYLLAKSNSSNSEIEAIKKDVETIKDKIGSTQLEWE